MVALTLEADLQDLHAQKVEMEKCVEGLSKHKEIQMSMAQTIKEFERRIQQLTDKIVSNQHLEDKIRAKISNIFKESVKELQLSDANTSSSNQKLQTERKSSPQVSPYKIP